MQFGLLEMWAAMGAVAKTVAIILIAMSIVSIYMLIERLLVFSRAKKTSRAVAPKLADLLKAGNLKDALSVSSKKDYKGSHLARVTAAGIQAIMEGKDAKLKLEEQIETASRGSERAKVLFNQELRRGLPILATIATSAPFIGLFGTIFGIINAFRGMQLTGSGGIGAVAGGIAEALVTTAVGIGVAVLALWVFNILNSRIEVFDAEMSNTESQVVDFFIKTGEAR
ncbi:MAG: MotA/TolQ/ExbB proton channel family protein [Candidatus Aminicenantes bacterium]|jgi:biopolymer transport protein ExbB/TolQ|nr:MotA/TolQ/ExbB proton channel family protein [Candidatus Aminicenantes bacterium]NLH77849.1 MotA/TolQ/ExbB proton channel family protein [Acidobacteriota bacterium]